MARSNGVLKENGHAGPPNGTVEKKKKAEEDVFEEENIFLFIPNIIGKRSEFGASKTFASPRFYEGEDRC